VRKGAIFPDQGHLAVDDDRGSRLRSATDLDTVAMLYEIAHFQGDCRVITGFVGYDKPLLFAPGRFLSVFPHQAPQLRSR